MESQPQNPEFSNNPETFHPCLHGLHQTHESQPTRFSTVKHINLAVNFIWPYWR